MKPLLLIAEHDSHGLKAATLATLSAAKHLSDHVDVLVVGSDAREAAAQAATYQGVQRVLINEHACYDHGCAETITALVLELDTAYDTILAAATTFGKNLLPRIAALKDIAMISDISTILDHRTVKRPIYAGNAIATIHDPQASRVWSIRTTAFTAATELAASIAPIVDLAHSHTLPCSRFISHQLTVSERPELTSARVIVSGGRALQSKDNFEALITPLADKLQAAIGASRAAVDAGFAPNDYQVGQTGKIVAPELYIAIGISGAIQHLAGMKDSRIIVVINKDTDSPLFQCADYALAGDLFQIVPELTSKL